MPKRKRKPDLYKRAQGYGVLHELHDKQYDDENPDWRPVAGFPEYEVNQNRQVRRITTGAPINPHHYPMRPHEGEFVDFWISGQRHVMSLESIMLAAFGQNYKRAANQ